MKKKTIVAAALPATTIGLDLSDRTFQFCELNAAGDLVEGQRKLDRAALRKIYGKTGKPGKPGHSRKCTRPAEPTLRCCYVFIPFGVPEGSSQQTEISQIS